HRSDADLAEDLHAHPVVALIGLETEPLLRLDRVESLALQLVGANLVGETDAAPFLIEIQQDAASFLPDAIHRGRELRAAIATDRVQDIAGEALRVHASEDVGAVADVAEHERDVLLLVDLVLEHVDLEL